MRKNGYSKKILMLLAGLNSICCCSAMEKSSKPQCTDLIDRRQTLGTLIPNLYDALIICEKVYKDRAASIETLCKKYNLDQKNCKPNELSGLQWGKCEYYKNMISMYNQSHPKNKLTKNHPSDYPNFARKTGFWNCQYYTNSVLNVCEDCNLPGVECAFTSPLHSVACLPLLYPDYSIKLVDMQFYEDDENVCREGTQSWVSHVKKNSKNSFVYLYERPENELPGKFLYISIPYWYITTILRSKFLPVNEWLRNKMLEDFKSIVNSDYIFCKPWVIMINKEGYAKAKVYDFKNLSELKFKNPHEFSNKNDKNDNNVEVEVSYYTTKDYKEFINLLEKSEPTVKWSEVKSEFVESENFKVRDTFELLREIQR